MSGALATQLRKTRPRQLNRAVVAVLVPCLDPLAETTKIKGIAASGKSRSGLQSINAAEGGAIGKISDHSYGEGVGGGKNRRRKKSGCCTSGDGERGPYHREEPIT